MKPQTTEQLETTDRILAMLQESIKAQNQGSKAKVSWDLLYSCLSTDDASPRNFRFDQVRLIALVEKLLTDIETLKSKT